MSNIELESQSLGEFKSLVEKHFDNNFLDYEVKATQNGQWLYADILKSGGLTQMLQKLLDYDKNRESYQNLTDGFHTRFSTYASKIKIHLISISGNLQNQNLGKKIVQNIVNVANELEVNKIELHAGYEVGGYAWAKYGFTPTQEAWRKLQKTLRITLKQVGSPNIEQQYLDTVKKAIELDNPKAIWLISDCKIGKKMLLGTKWDGEIYLKCEVAMARLNSYLGKAQNIQRAK